MTLNDLRDEIAELGFDQSVTTDKSLAIAANRALVTIFTERPVAKTVRITVRSQSPTIHIPKIIHKGGEDSAISLVGKAYVFRVSGKGHFTVKDGLSELSRSFSTEDALFRGKIRNAGAKIIFSGDFLYTVTNFTCYGELIGSDEEDIEEYTDTHEYDINSLFGDFLAHLEPPRSGGIPIPDAIIQNGTVRIPREKYDEFELTYARMPRRVTVDFPNEAIDISGECAPLLSLLTAAYIWLDDDAERAQYYMSLYRSAMGFIRRYNTSISSAAYDDVLGWA